MDDNRLVHRPVMLSEVIGLVENFQPEVICDLTMGQAGHLTELIKTLTPRLALANDMDPQMQYFLEFRLRNLTDKLNVSHCKNSSRYDLELDGKRVKLLFRRGRLSDSIDWILHSISSERVQLTDLRLSLLLDLGISTYQLLFRNGLSFSKDTPLDMRLDPCSNLTAVDILNHYPAEKLRELFWQLGGCKFSTAIVKKIVKVRRYKPIETTAQLKSIIESAVPRRFLLRTLRQVFQALRMEVNSELQDLKLFLENLRELGRDLKIQLVAICYNSLERETVKRILLPHYKLTSKLRPSSNEIRENPSARSAILYEFRNSVNNK